MLRKFFTIGFLSLAAVLTSNVHADWADKEDGVLYLNADEDGDEYFVVEIDDDEVEITRYSFEGNQIDVDDKDYDLEDIHQIIFTGDNDTDGFYNYTDIPSIAYGLGGDDYLMGGSNRDDLYGGWGIDILDGGGDNDLLDAGYDWNDGIIIGGAGFDTAYKNYSFRWGTWQYTFQQFNLFDVENTIYRMPRVFIP